MMTGHGKHAAVEMMPNVRKQRFGKANGQGLCCLQGSLKC